MSASENQAAEARMDTGVRKIGTTGNKIRIRLPLPLRKRWAEGLQTMSTRLPEDMKKHAAKEVSEYTDDNTDDTAEENPNKKLKTSAGKCGEANEATKVYKKFLEKVKRSVYLDNLSGLATDAVISTALNQFGNVKNVSFLTNYTVPFDIPQSALVEMETEKDAESVVNILDEFPFMMSGMPRPVRAKHATAEMFNDRPCNPGRKLEFCWVGPTDPDCHDVRKFKLMSKRHELENLALIKNELQEEALLAKHQQDNLDCHHRKLETVDSVITNGWINHLTHIYNLGFDDMY